MPEYNLSKYYGQPDYKDSSEEPETPTYDLTSYYTKEPDPEPSFMDDLSGALSSGYRNMKAGLAGTGVLVGAVEPETAAISFVDAIKNQPETPDYYKNFLAKAEAEGKDVTEAEGIWDTTIESLDLAGELLLEAVTNPKGLAYLVTESAAQSIPSIALGGIGAAAGLPLGGVGAIAGLSVGTGLGTFAVEAGGHLKGLVVDKLRAEGRALKDVNEQDIVEVFEQPEFMDWAESEATKRGLSVATVEGLFAAFGGKILSGAAGKSVFSKAARGAADVGVETIGEATGEFAGQLATEGDIDPGGIALEAIAGMGQSVATTATGASVRTAARAARPKDRLDELFGEGVDDIAGDALDNLNAATTAEPAVEPTSLEQETTDAMDLIGEHADLTDTYAGYQQSGMLEQSIIGALYEDALTLSHPQRTEGQKALVAMGREAEQAAMSPIDKMRGQTEEAVSIAIPEATAEEKAAVPEALRSTSDIIQEITDEQVTEKITAEPITPVGEPRPVAEGVIPTAEPSGAVVQAEEQIALAPSERTPEEVRAELDIAANQAATSETNALLEPNEEQAKAGDYKKGLLDLNGFGIAIENPKGSTRSGKDAQGKEWSTKMKDHYGEIQNTEGADGDNVDVFIGDNPESQKVFVVDQIDPATGKFDEHKVIMGVNDIKQAKRTYNRNYAKGWKGAAEITEMTVDGFRQWVNFGDTRKPMKYKEVTVELPRRDMASEKDKPGRGVPTAKRIADSRRRAEPIDERVIQRDEQKVGSRPEGLSDQRADTRPKHIPKKLPIDKAKAVRAKVQQIEAPTAEPVEAKKPEPSVDKKAEARKKAKEVKATDSLMTAVSKRGGLNLEHWISQGIDPADLKGSTAFKKVFGLPPARKGKGMTADDVAEMAEELGYGKDMTEAEAVDLIMQDIAEGNVLTAEGLGSAAAAEFDLQAQTEAEAQRVADIERAPAPTPEEFDLTGSGRMRDLAPPGQEDIFGAIQKSKAVDQVALDKAIEIESEVVFDNGDVAKAAGVIVEAIQKGASLDQAIIKASEEVSVSAAADVSVRINKATKGEPDVTKIEQVPETTAERVEIPTEDKAEATKEMRAGEPEGVTAEELVPETSTLSEAVKRGVTNTLDFINARTEVESHREIIDRIRDNVPMGLKIQTLKIGDIDPSKRGMKSARGLYQAETNTIFLKDESFVENGMSEETILHEVLHAVTQDLITTGNLKANKGSDLFNAVQDLYKLQSSVVSEFNRRMKNGWKPQTNVARIATENVHELVSWGMTNPEFQDMLKSMPAESGSVWNKFVTAISRMLGISEDSQNALSELMIATDKIISADYRVDQAMRDQLSVVRESSSYKVAAKSLPQTEEIELLQTQAAALQFDVDTKSDITAGKKLKEANSRVELLQEEVQEQRATDPYFEVGTDDIDTQGDVLMGKPASRMTLRERLKSFFDGLKVMGGDIPYIMGRITSSAYVIEAQERKTHGSRLTAEDSMTAAVHKSWNSKVAASMAIHEHGVSMENGTIVPDHTKPGLSQILEEVAKHGERYLRRFEQYLLLQRSKELMAQDRENFVTQDNIDLMDSWLDRNPNTKALFERQQQAFRDWNRGTLDIAIASGWINKQDAYGGYVAFDAEGNEVFNAGKTLFETEADALEVGDKAEAVEGWYSDMYVPFYRIADDKGTRKPGVSRRTAGDVAKAVKKLKGGEGQIPILENIVKNAEFIINGSMRTIAMQKIETEFRDSVMEEMDGVEVPGLIDAAEMREEYRSIQEEAALQGEPVPKMGQADAKRWAQMKSFARPTDKSTVVVYRDGRPKYYKVLDERLLIALKSIGAPRANKWLKVFGMPTRLLQKSITITPAFLARSFVRELQNAFIVNRKGGVNPLKTIGKGLKNFAKIAKGDKAWMDTMMTGGFVNYNTYFNVTPDKLRKKLEKVGVKRSTFKNIVLSPWEGAKSLGRMYMQIAVASEHASRKTVHDDFIRAGASKDEAMYQALDTMNFSRRSDFVAMEMLLATVPFLNPRIQGLDRLYRGAKEDWKPFALKAGLMFTSASILAFANWEENEDEMNKLKDEDKAMNYHIFLDLGGPTKEHWRIPKGFEVGQITGTLPEFFIEQLYADQAEPASKALRRFMMTTFGLQAPQFAAPAYAIATNEDPFRQRPIINYGQQFLLPSAQLDAWTSKLVVDISQSMPSSAPEWIRSPKQFEYLIKGYTGSAGAMVLEGIDDIYRMTGNAPDLPTKKASELYLVRDFYRTGSVSSSKQMDLFYEMVTETGKLASTLKAAKETSRAEYREIRVEHGAKLRARKALNKYSRQMSQMSSQLRKIMQSESISSDEKERRKDALTKRKNALAQKAVDRYWYIFD